MPNSAKTFLRLILQSISMVTEKRGAFQAHLVKDVASRNTAVVAVFEGQHYHAVLAFAERLTGQTIQERDHV